MQSAALSLEEPQEPGGGPRVLQSRKERRAAVSPRLEAFRLQTAHDLGLPETATLHEIFRTVEKRDEASRAKQALGLGLPDTASWGEILRKTLEVK